MLQLLLTRLLFWQKCSTKDTPSCKVYFSCKRSHVTVWLEKFNICVGCYSQYCQCADWTAARVCGFTTICSSRVWFNLNVIVMIFFVWSYSHNYVNVEIMEYFVYTYNHYSFISVRSYRKWTDLQDHTKKRYQQIFLQNLFYYVFSTFCSKIHA